MIRNLFIDFVIVLALCAVVWGSVPVLVFAQGTFYTEEELLELGFGDGVLKATSTQRCCRRHGQEAPCGVANQGDLKLCIILDLDCSYTRNSYWFALWTVKISCSCRNWAESTFIQGGANAYILRGCACG